MIIIYKRISKLKQIYYVYIFTNKGSPNNLVYPNNMRTHQKHIYYIISETVIIYIYQRIYKLETKI